METPTTRYARIGEASIAYQVVGEGDIDMLLVPGWAFQVEHVWEAPPLRRYLERIAEFTRRAAELGDQRWRDLLAKHDETVRGEIARFGGREVKTMGDGFLVTFSGPPSSALRCGQAIGAAVRELGIEVRIGVHTGECEISGDDVGGMAVNIAARVMGLAGPSEILASGAVVGAVVGGPFAFEERGTPELKGVPGRWPVFGLQPA